MIELLIVIGVIGIFFVSASLLYPQLEGKNNLDIATTVITQQMRRAQLLSQAVQGDESWGVKVNAEEVILFRGNSYLTRDAQYDEIFEIDDEITLQGVTEVVFSKVFGIPNATGNLLLSLPSDEERTITIGAKGQVHS